MPRVVVEQQQRIQNNVRNSGKEAAALQFETCGKSLEQKHLEVFVTTKHALLCVNEISG